MTPVKTYGCPTEGKTQFFYDRWAFANRIDAVTMGCSRADMFRKLADTMVPGWFEWHDWTNRIVEAACRRRWVGIGGCSNSAKTRNVAGFAATWWLAAPHESSVIFCSTTMKMLRKRGWAEIQNYHRAFGGDFGNMVDSRTTWQFQQHDDRHAIFGIAVGEGEVNDAAANIQGVHTRRQMVVIDEAEAVQAAIWTAAANLYAYPVDAGGEFVFICVANPRSRLSRFGRFIEPDGGWDSVSVETEEWESKPQLDGKRAQVIRLDFLKSPNVTSGHTVSKHLPTRQRVDGRLRALKDRGAENDPNHWCFDRGFPPPEGLSQTVFTESLFVQADAFRQHTFTGNGFQIIGAFDQAFGGGDRPTIRFGAMGELRPGVLGIEWMEPKELAMDASNPKPKRYQLMEKCREACANVNYRGGKYQCPPENFGIDCTGEGGLADICQEEWSPRIIRIMFSGACSEDPCSYNDDRPANKVYKNKRAEMYFRSRDGVSSGQIKGVDKDTAEELCTLEYVESKADGTAKLITIQDKKQYKLKFSKSPDYADSGVMLTEVAWLKGFRLMQVGLTVMRSESFVQLVKSADAVYEDVAYDPDNDEDFIEA